MAEPRTEAGRRLLDQLWNDLNPSGGEPFDTWWVNTAILAIEAEAAWRAGAPRAEPTTGEQAGVPFTLRSEAQDTAASSGLREAVLTLPVERIEGDGPIGHIEDFDLVPPMVEVIGRDAVLAILATPEPEAGRETPPAPSETPPAPSDEQEANSAAWHESIRRAQAARSADETLEALTAALDALRLGHESGNNGRPRCSMLMPTDGPCTCRPVQARAILEVEPRLTLDASSPRAGE